MQIEHAAITHPGRVRKNNEDAYLLNALDGEDLSINGPAQPLKVDTLGLLAAVADGMGGAAAGEVASREGLAAVAVTLFGHWGRVATPETPESGLLEALKLAVDQASQAVLRYSDDDRTARGMGSTLTAAVLWNAHLYVAQIGDSRAYVYREGTLVQVTVDQTVVNDMVAAGAITPEQAKVHPQRNMITQALGSPQPLQVALYKVPLRRGDRLLLCSDGLHGEVDDARLREILDQRLPPSRTLELMVQAALDHGGRDNVTAVLLSLSDPELPAAQPGEPVTVLKPGEARPEPPAGLLKRLGRWFRRTS